MTARELRRQAKRRIEGLASERLQVADDFLAYLEDRESSEATEELLRIPGFMGRFRQAQREVAAGETTSLEALKKRASRNGKTKRRRQP